MQVFTSVVVLVIFFLAYIISDIRDYKVRKTKSVMSLAHVVGMNSISAILFHDNETGNEILAELKNVAPEIAKADIYDSDGKIFASYIRPDTIVRYAVLDIKEAKTYFAEKLLFVVDEIQNNNEVIGKVLLQVELTELAEIKKAKFEMAVILIIAAIAISFIIAFTVQPYISRRLLNLVNVMKLARGSGNYNVPITDDGKDEISTLIQAFNNLMKEVNESQQRKDEFIGIASHELKTPLTGIKGYLDLLNVMETKQPNKQCVEKALESAGKLEKLIRDLLDVSKIQSGHLQLSVTEFNIDDLIDETVAAMQMVSSSHEITRKGERENVLICADKQKIEQVLINIFSNAVKYSPNGSKVIISTKKMTPSW